MKKTIFFLTLISATWSLKNLKPVSQVVTTEINGGGGWDFSIAVTNGRTDWILYPRGTFSPYTIQLETASNTAYIEYTITPPNDISNSAAVFVWSLGVCSTNAVTTFLGPIVAWRLVGLTNISRASYRI